MPYAIFAVAALLLVIAIWSKRRKRKAAPDPQTFVPEDDSPFPTISKAEIASFVLNCLRDHQAMSCYVRGQEHFLLPLSLTGDRLTAIPLGLGYDEKARLKTLKLSSIRDPHISEMNPKEHDITLIRLAIKHSSPLSLRYLDDSGHKIECEAVPIKEEDGFLVCDGSRRIRMQWIEGAQVASVIVDANAPQFRPFVDDLILSPELRLSGVFLAGYLRGDEHLPLIVKLAGDADDEVRGAVADTTRRYTERIQKTVMGKTYSFVDREQDLRIFELLETLSTDKAPTVRLKAAYALGDHPGEKTAAILYRLAFDPAEEVRKAADHATQRLAEQTAIFTAYTAAGRAARMS